VSRENLETGNMVHHRSLQEKDLDHVGGVVLNKRGGDKYSRKNHPEKRPGEEGERVDAEKKELWGGEKKWVFIRKTRDYRFGLWGEDHGGLGKGGR